MNTRRFYLFLTIIAILGMLAVITQPAQARGAIIYVPDNYPTIREAINTANANDMVHKSIIDFDKSSVLNNISPEPTPTECPEGFYETAGDVWAINPYDGHVRVLPNNASGWQDKPAVSNIDYVSISVNNSTGDVWAMNYHDGWVKMLPFKGSDWLDKPAIGATTQGIYNIAVNSSTGEVWTMEYNGRVLMLSNGGTSWQEMPSPGDEWYAWFGLSVNSNTGDVWVIHRESGRAFMLSNGGANWQEKPSATPSNTGYPDFWWGLSVNSNTGDVWAMRGDGKVMMLPNGGASWEDKPALNSTSWFQISVNSKTGDVWAVNYNGVVKMLPDGGTSWQDKPALGSTGWHGFFVVAPSCVHLDILAPVTEAVLSGAQGNNGWYTSDVQVALSALDNEGGVGVLKTEYSLDGGNWQEYTQPFTLTQEGSTTVLYRSVDKVNNPEQDKTIEFKIDKTAPVVAWVGDINNGDNFYFGFVPAAPTCTAVDNVSDVDGSCDVSGFTSMVGTHLLTATVKDQAGNQATELRSYTVLDWALQGFYQPVDMNGIYNVVKGGSTVPLKFEIFADSTELTDIVYIKSLTHAQTSCDANVTTDEIETTTTGGTSLRYDTIAGQFIYNWKTPNTAGKCYRLTMTTIDGSSLVAYFKLK